MNTTDAKIVLYISSNWIIKTANRQTAPESSATTAPWQTLHWTYLGGNINRSNFGYCNSKQISNCIFFLVTCKARLYIWVQPHIKSLFRRGRNTAVFVFRHTIVTNFVMYLPTLWKVPYLLLINFIRYITFIVRVYFAFSKVTRNKRRDIKRPGFYKITFNTLFPTTPGLSMDNYYWRLSPIITSRSFVTVPAWS